MYHDGARTLAGRLDEAMDELRHDIDKLAELVGSERDEMSCIAGAFNRLREAMIEYVAQLGV